MVFCMAATCCVDKVHMQAVPVTKCQSGYPSRDLYQHPTSMPSGHTRTIPFHPDRLLHRKFIRFLPQNVTLLFVLHVGYS